MENIPGIKAGQEFSNQFSQTKMYKRWPFPGPGFRQGLKLNQTNSNIEPIQT